ncbi:hypothetical protein AAC387_Pa01g2998 [Persea americana]
MILVHNPNSLLHFLLMPIQVQPPQPCQIIRNSKRILKRRHTEQGLHMLNFLKAWPTIITAQPKIPHIEHHLPYHVPTVLPRSLSNINNCTTTPISAALFVEVANEVVSLLDSLWSEPIKSGSSHELGGTTRLIFFHCSPKGELVKLRKPRLEYSVPMVRGLDAKMASCVLRNSRAMSGQVTAITWTRPRRMQAMSVFMCFIGAMIHRNAGLLKNMCGRLPTGGHGVGPGGSGGVFCFLCLRRRKKKEKNSVGRRKWRVRELAMAISYLCHL